MEQAEMRHQEAPEELRPYEKYEACGAEALTDAELMAVLIKAGVKGKSAVELAEEIIAGSVQSGGETGLRSLLLLTDEDLKRIPGIGRVKTIQIMCMLELSRRIAAQKAAARLEVCSPERVADYFMEELRRKSEEEVWLMLLNSKCQLIRNVKVSMGTVDASVISPREIFLTALKYRASGFILVHNHPSGDPEASDEDTVLTQNLYRLGKMMHIELMDSVIIGDNAYMSFLEKGLLY